MMKYILTLFLFMANLQTVQAATQTQVVILLGPPGSGKGSQATLLKEKVELAHISTGDLLRNNIKQQTELGKKAKSYMEKGDLVPDDLIFSMLFKRVTAPDCAKGYILDGFPRNLEQAQTFQKRLSEESNVIAINLEVPDATLVERITKRQICKECQTPYHLTFSPPKVEDVCDRCNGELYQRSDDTEAVVKSRLKVYHEQTAPLIGYYGKQGNLHTVNGNQQKERVTAELTELFSVPAKQHKVGAGNMN